MKKVVIINSPLYIEKNSKNIEDYLPPLGLGIIYSAIENKFNVSFIDSLADNLGVDDVITKLLKSKNINFVCINIFTTNFSLVKKIVEEVKNKIHWIIGGISTKSLYKEIFKWETDNQIDIVYGDGEIITEKIINSSLTKAPNDENENCRFFIIDPLSQYYVKDISYEILNRRIFKHEPQINFFSEIEACIYTSRGCPYNCAYCVAAHSRNKELGNNIRHKSVDSIILELENIKKQYIDVVAIRILDDLFLNDKKSFENAIYIFNKFNFSWRAMCHIKSIVKIDDKTLKDIVKSGCKELFIGIESGSSSILNRIHKINDIDIIITNVNRVLNSGIDVKAYFICGFPNEKESDLKKTLELASILTISGKEKDVKFRNSTFQFRPYYGTELYDEIVKTQKLHSESILYSMQSSEKINFQVRNKSFNFDSGNYSSINDEKLIEFIKKMNKLND